MKFSIAATTALLLADSTQAFVNPSSPFSSGPLKMAVDMPPVPAAASSDLPVIQRSQYGPSDVRYSDFLRLVDGDRIEKVTFSSDGSQLLGVDVDGTRLKIEALPNDPALLTQLTEHKVCWKLILLLLGMPYAAILLEFFFDVFKELTYVSFSFFGKITIQSINPSLQSMHRLMSLFFHNKKPLALVTSPNLSSSPPLSSRVSFS